MAGETARRSPLEQQAGGRREASVVGEAVGSIRSASRAQTLARQAGGQRAIQRSTVADKTHGAARAAKAVGRQAIDRSAMEQQAARSFGPDRRTQAVEQQADRRRAAKRPSLAR